MNECICTTCKNLKPKINEENGIVDDYSCEFGFPSTICQENCLDENCNLTCIHYIQETDEEEAPRIVSCCKCSKELKQSSNSEDGNYYCIDCFLNH